MNFGDIYFNEILPNNVNWELFPDIFNLYSLIYKHQLVLVSDMGPFLSGGYVACHHSIAKLYVFVLESNKSLIEFLFDFFPEMSRYFNYLLWCLQKLLIPFKVVDAPPYKRNSSRGHFAFKMMKSSYCRLDYSLGQALRD